MRNGVRSGQAATVLNEQYDSRIQPRDLHRIMQTNREKARSLSDAEISAFEMQRLKEEITKHGDQYRIKYM